MGHQSGNFKWPIFINRFMAYYRNIYDELPKIGKLLARLKTELGGKLRGAAIEERRLVVEDGVLVEVEWS